MTSSSVDNAGLSTAEQTGSPVFHTLWSFVLEVSYDWFILLRGSQGKRSPIKPWTNNTWSPRDVKENRSPSPSARCMACCIIFVLFTGKKRKLKDLLHAKGNNGMGEGRKKKKKRRITASTRD
ncbi:uncharacterized protein P174DRAFT_51041 [Aspergillus novofumigatus IBT 16806]|uniref:Uncharacterized protein n=1 Tax=Aspergillus novofumigatus (strain IBT 16806) TaxID=1392255 RepID=A0A2I1CPK3_ASPN1|nr:uncharacterized protein P174DRAFT_51041 [Aspergillus novofumigatus IBT 16806]PKX99560.1 hypothetical protein P174DRAFT_51041 [Aspergillus novofumigatus IBT 16806]